VRDLDGIDEDHILAGWRAVNDKVRQAKAATEAAIEERATYASAALATRKVTQARLGSAIGVSRERVKAMAMTRAERSAARRIARAEGRT
jgi:hypothetical protein